MTKAPAPSPRRSAPRLPPATAAVLAKQLDQPAPFVATAFAGAIAAILADAASDQQLNFLGFKLELSTAFGIAAAAFVITTVIVCQTCWRAVDLLRGADDTAEPEFLSTVFTHSWSLNPFAYFGGRPFSILHSALGAGMLTFIWWTCRVALALLAARWGTLNPFAAVMYYGFMAGGVATLWSLAAVHGAILRRLKALAASGDSAWQGALKGFRATAIARAVFAALASLAGWSALYQFTHIGA